MKIYYIAPVHHRKTRIKRELEILLASSFINLQIQAKSLSDIEDGVNSAGEKVFSVLQTVGFWVCAIACVYEILMKIKDGDQKSVYSVLTKYAMIYLPVFLVKLILTWIGGVFA